MQKREKITKEYVLGIVESEGRFTFSTRTRKLANKTVIQTRVPTFSINMHEDNRNLLELVKKQMGLENKIYIYKSKDKDGYNRAKKALLIVRGYGAIKNIVVPYFYGQLVGGKAIQFKQWIERMGDDPLVADGYGLICRLHKNGYYAKNPKFSDNLVKREKSKSPKSTKT
ncbi:MAG: hypothetical protein COT89_01870 [Candidatus Colwellbacteria bacterium CG10_big_fil_rev_8_21_14_0_10_42_22]|uniref:Homing endonuclease LAGLIDADG domain-containing protein n=1 Tax=Candidatus Colwellbacteria bacterium CG10_big_fil_rev_8_21_14_0_10_42_22 TaxID=1974540 RepID=A0A2H0VFW5_9BACT|nr:MAG: hypothetical protein COT89_01870 [Candidatus Colwellbacteria bacterium CG10_big_fil_rev_8_21_14_0_10_42_22]